MREGELVNYVLQGNQPAMQLFSDLASISQHWDDVIDRDKEVSDKAINDCFIRLLSDIPRNPFYRQYFDELQPLIESAIIDWLTSNVIVDKIEVSWVLRDNLANVLIGMAKIIGGMAWAIEISPGVRRWVHDEPIDEYRKTVVKK